LFETQRGRKPADDQRAPERLDSEIDRLKMGLDWLKKKVWVEPVSTRRGWIVREGEVAVIRQCALT
jgi:hypothetical protein